MLKGTTLLLPTNASNPASMVAQALNIYKNLTGKNAGVEFPETSQAELTQSDSSAESIDEDSEKDHWVLCWTRLYGSFIF